MKKYILLLVCLPTLLFSQVYDDFSDGDMTSDPAWMGSTEKFIINNSLQLQLNDSIENMSYLSTLYNSPGKSEWRCWVRLSFSPSTNNYARVYLVSDQSDLTLPLNGYFLQLGESGSADAIELFRQEGHSLTSVCRGSEGFISSSFSSRIKVTKDETGQWQLWADPDGGEAFQLQAEGIDDQVNDSGYMGVCCHYTKSNASKMYFDEFYAGPWIIDQSPPVLQSMVADSDSTLLLSFNEPLDTITSTNPENYFVSGDMGNPVLVTSGSDLATLSLQFDKKFNHELTYSLSVSGIKDLAGNPIVSEQFEFSFYQPQAYDIVINEIMADPNPSVSLPDYEYMELFNRTNLTLNIDQWVLTIGTNDKLLENVSIPPHGFLILAKDDAEEELGLYGPFYGFTSFSLTNGGQDITLKDKYERVISSVNYSDDWYKDPDKRDGGWSLEQINPEEVCSMEANWKASENLRGGTPGERNSVFNDSAGYPVVHLLEVTDAHTLLVHFSQYMDPASLSQLSLYFVDGDIGNPGQVNIWNDELNKAWLIFESAFKLGTTYQLRIDQQMMNCMGTPLAADTQLLFGLPYYAEEKDVLINEILFNPWLHGSDFVEMYNHSQKVIDLSTLMLGTVKVNPPNPNDTLYYSLSEKQRLILPNAYLVLTREPEAVKEQYFTINPSAFIVVDPFPAYNDDEGICLLANQSGEIIDAFDYSEDMHYPLLKYLDGVSLERTGFNGNSNDAVNWHSAAESAGFGTPGYQNSQFISNEINVGEIAINPEIFSPDNDGYHDMTSIDYHFDQPGHMMTVNIFGSNGNLVRQLVNNKYLGTVGSVQWNGLQDDNTKAPIGIYVFLIQVFDLKGNVKQYKKTGVLAGDLSSH